jgi:hypothetical protein
MTLSLSLMDLRSLRRALPAIDTSLPPTQDDIIAPPRALLTARDRPTSFDVAAVLHLLSSPTSPLATRLRLLPPELALYVLDCAGYWHARHAHRDWRIRAAHFGGGMAAMERAMLAPDGRLYLRAPPLPHGTPRALRRVVIRIAARAGGEGTNEVWFELALMRPRGTASIEPCARVRLAWDEDVGGVPQTVVLDKTCTLLQAATPGDAFGIVPRAAGGCTVFVEAVECVVYLGPP